MLLDIDLLQVNEKSFYLNRGYRDGIKRRETRQG